MENFWNIYSLTKKYYHNNDKLFLLLNMSRESQTRHIKSQRVVESWHIAGDGHNIQEREIQNDPLGELCSLTKLHTCIVLDKRYRKEVVTTSAIPIEKKFWKTSGS